MKNSRGKKVPRIFLELSDNKKCIKMFTCAMRTHIYAYLVLIRCLSAPTKLFFAPKIPFSCCDRFIHDNVVFSWSLSSRPPSNVTVTFQKKFYVRDLFVWSIRTHPYAQIVPSIPGSASTKNRGLLFSSPGCCFFFRQQNELKLLHISITVTFPLQIL